MPQEHTTMGDILTKMREIISDEPASPEPRPTPPRAPELHVVSTDTPPSDVVTAIPRPASRNTRPADALETGPGPSISAGTLETVFTSAIRDAITPTAQRWVSSHQAELIYALKPMIKSWMDEHLPKLVEGILKDELSRAIGKSLRR